MLNATFFRRQAEICLALARGTIDLAVAVRLRTMAEEFRRIADDLDDADDPFEPAMAAHGGTSDPEFPET